MQNNYPYIYIDSNGNAPLAEYPHDHPPPQPYPYPFTFNPQSIPPTNTPPFVQSPWITFYPRYEGPSSWYGPNYIHNEHRHRHTELSLLPQLTSLPLPPPPPAHIHSTVNSHVDAHHLLRVSSFESREYAKRRSYLVGWITFNHNNINYDLYSYHHGRNTIPIGLYSESIVILDSSVYSLFATQLGSLPPPGDGPSPSCAFEILDQQPLGERRPGMYATRHIVLDGQPILVEHPAFVTPYLFAINSPEYQEEVYKGIWARLEMSSSPSSSHLKHSLTRIAKEWRGREGVRGGGDDGFWNGTGRNGDWKVLREVLAIRGFAIRLEVPKEGPFGELEMHRAVFLQAGMCNQSSKPNARYEWDSKTLSLSLYPLKPIMKGEEITIAYQGVSCTRPAFSLRVKEYQGRERRDNRNTNRCKCLDCALAFVNASPSNASVPAPSVASPRRFSYAAPLAPLSVTSPSLDHDAKRSRSWSCSYPRGCLLYATGGASDINAAYDRRSDNAEDITITIFGDNDNRSPVPEHTPQANNPPTSTTCSRTSCGGSCVHDDLSTSALFSDVLSINDVADAKVSAHPSVSALTAAVVAGLPTFREWLHNPDIHDFTLIEYHLKELRDVERAELHELNSLVLVERGMVKETEGEVVKKHRNRDSVSSVRTSSSSSSSCSDTSYSSCRSSNSTSTAATTVASELSSADSALVQVPTPSSAGFPVAVTARGRAGAKSRTEARQTHTEAIAMCFGALGQEDMFQYWAALVRDGKLGRALKKEIRTKSKAEMAGVNDGNGYDDGRGGMTKDLKKGMEGAQVIAPSAGLLDVDDAGVVQRWIENPETFPLWGKKAKVKAKATMEGEARR